MITVQDRPQTPSDTRISVEDGRNRFDFERLTVGDVHGTPIEDVENPVVYVGKNKGPLHYIDGKDVSNVPDPILDALREDGYTVVTNVDGGWKEWNGRPEFSKAYLDLSDAEVVE